MANFQPMKNRFLLVLRHNLELFSIRAPFIDYGCGRGDVAEYLIEDVGMSEGVAYDPSFDAEVIERRTAMERKGDLVYTDTLDGLAAKPELAVLFDVIEHVPNADEMLQEIHGLVADDGWLAMTVPYNAHEWGHDDDFYGHLRRLSKQGIVTMLERNGWDVIRVLDPTFPTFWFIRRVYLLLTRGQAERTRSATEEIGTDMDRSLASSRQTAWAEDVKMALPQAIASNILPWRLIRRFDLYFESVFWGFELFVMSRKRGRDNTCEVCVNGVTTYHRFFDRYALQRCRYCGSERVLCGRPDDAADGGADKQYRGWVRSILHRLHLLRGRHLRSVVPPDESLLDVRCGPGLVAAEFAERGWRVLGTTMSPTDAGIAREAGVHVFEGDLADVPEDAPFGLISLFHVVEHVDDLQATLSKLDRLLLPGGYLVMEYPNGNSLLKALLAWRWFGYDPPYHRLQIHPRYLSDHLGVRNYRLLRESHFSFEYSFFVFAQSMANLFLPFQRDALYRFLSGRPTDVVQVLGGLLSLPIFVVSAILFVPYQLLVALLRRGCIVRQTFRKTDILDEGAEPAG